MARRTPNILIDTTQKLRDRLGFKEFVLQVNKETFIYQFRPSSISVSDSIYFTLNLNNKRFIVDILEVDNIKDYIDKVSQNEWESFNLLILTSESDNSSLLVDRILNANKRFRDQDIDDTANDVDINLSCEVNIISNAYDINAQTTTIEESSNSQAAVESNESDDIIIESYIVPSSKGPGKDV